MIAISVRVGFCQPELTQHAPSVTKTFIASQHWQNGLTTEPFGLTPIRAPPTSWTKSPGVVRSHSSCKPFMNLVSSGVRTRSRKPATMPPAAWIISTAAARAASCSFRSLSVQAHEI